VTPAGRLELAAEARASVERVMTLLERPTLEALDQSAAELLNATAQIEKIKDDGTSGGAPLKSVMAELRKDLRRVKLLLRHAWEFRAATSDQVGYTRRGELTAQTVPATRWILEG
jgi:hypothetical protein